LAFPGTVVVVDDVAVLGACVVGDEEDAPLLREVEELDVVRAGGGFGARLASGGGVVGVVSSLPKI
jgi:hypothetical protein